MGPQDHLSVPLDGLGCTVCEERVPAERVRLLAWRDDLRFVQVSCASCGSTALGFVADEALQPEADRLAAGAPVSTDDVLDMHEFLDGWAGDLTSLVDGPQARPTRQAGTGVRRARRPA